MSQQTKIHDFLAELQQQTSGRVLTDRPNRLLYSTDASIYQVMPHGVLIPQTIEDVHAAVELAAKHQVPLLPRAGGSSLAGQAVNEALIIDSTRHLDQILELNVEEQWVRVQPGLVLDALNAHLRPHGLQFGPDPASSNRAAIGGIVGNNSTGSHSILYGMTADHVLETTVLLSDGSEAHFKPLTKKELAHYQQKSGREGDIYRQINALVWDPANREIIRRGTPTHWRRCGGYNLARFITDGTIDHYLKMGKQFNLSNLMVGSEGTLGIIKEVKLNLVKRPRKTAVAIVEFNDLHTALEAVPIILQTNPSAVELLDNLGLTLAQNVPDYARLMRSFLEGQPFCLLITEFYGRSERELQQKIDHLKAHLQQHKVRASAVNAILPPEKQAKVWQLRKAGLGLLMSLRGDYKPVAFIEDTAVPVDHLVDYIPRIEQFCASLGTKMAYYAHASAGCLHIRPLINLKQQDEIDKMPQIQQFVLELLGEYGGALSSEHGDGRARSWLNRQFFGDELYELYSDVKRIFDPENLLNPGNIVHAEPMTQQLRFGADYATMPVKSYLDFSHDHGFAAAVEMCNGAGVCRKRTAGTMCPSFMATRDEKDSTRGRANMLRAALSGQLPEGKLTSPAVYDALDLCLSCKACKAECPSTVDMAKMKTEWLAHYYDEHGIPFRAKFFANIETLSRLASGRLAPLVNWGASLPLVKQGMNKLLGISAERDLPQFAREPFTTWFKKHQRPSKRRPFRGDQIRPTVVLFNDTYNTYNYPQVAIAATEVLEANGMQVLLPGVTDCGRPALSKGLVKQAQATAEKVLDRLYPYAAAGLPIVFLEPSELSAVIDDYAALLPHDERVKVVAARCFLFEQFLVHLAEKGELNLVFDQRPRQFLLHGHCHQKALLTTAASHKMLALIPNATITEVDSGCCGMAGSFGYEAEHYDVSLKVGESRLLPAVRAVDPTTIVVAAGVSCREQIHHGASRTAQHPAEVMRQALKVS